MALQFFDYASTMLSTGVNASQTTFNVVIGASFPLTPGNSFYATLIDQPSYQSNTVPPAQREIVLVTAVNGNTLTVQRGVGTPPLIWNAGDVIECRANAAALTALGAAAGGNYLAPYTGAVARTQTSKLGDVVSVKDFGAIGDGVSDDTGAFQAAVAAIGLLPTAGTVFVPQGLYRLTGSVSVPLNVRLLGNGKQNPSKILVTGNFAAFVATLGPCQFEELYFLGTANGAFTAQEAIHATGINYCIVKDCYFTQLYNSLRFSNVCFYCKIESCDFFDVVNAHVVTDGGGSAGVDLALHQVNMTPSTGTYGLLLNNLGSLTMSDVAMTPGGFANNTCFIQTVASGFGGCFFSQCVFEGSVNSTLRMDGTALLPVKFCFFVNCWFLNSGAFDAISIAYANDLYFEGCYVSGTSHGFGLTNAVTRLGISNTVILTSGAAVFAYSGATVAALTMNGVTFINASQRYVELSLAASVTGLNVIGGNWGSFATPLNLPAGVTNASTLVNPAGDVVFGGGNLSVGLVGGGLRVAEGSNAKQGTAVLSGGTKVVGNTSVTANSRILLTSNVDGGTPGWLRVSARAAGTSFTITSSSGSDTSTVAWQIFEPA